MTALHLEQKMVKSVMSVPVRSAFHSLDHPCGHCLLNKHDYCNGDNVLL